MFKSESPKLLNSLSRSLHVKLHEHGIAYRSQAVTVKGATITFKGESNCAARMVADHLVDIFQWGGNPHCFKFKDREL